MPAKYLRINIISLIFALLFFCYNSYAKGSNVIKVALLDTFYNEIPLVRETSEYEKAYFAGIETAAYEAKKNGLDIRFKSFIYDTGPLDILNEIPKLLEWNADLIMGPSSSDQCLLLGKYLPNIMTLSSYASDINLETLPKNFYSTFPSDDHIMEL